MICADFLAGASVLESGFRFPRCAPSLAMGYAKDLQASSEAAPIKVKRRRIQFTSPPSTRTRCWRCRNFGSSKDLHVHHLAKRSKLGDDALYNLITLALIKGSTVFLFLLATFPANALGVCLVDWSDTTRLRASTLGRSSLREVVSKDPHSGTFRSFRPQETSFE